MDLISRTVRTSRKILSGQIPISHIPHYAKIFIKELRATPRAEQKLKNLSNFIEKFITENPQTAETASILYADINLNVVDGSSVWLSSMASILCAEGPCILVAKKSVATDIITSNILNQHNLIILSPEQIGQPGRTISVENAISVIRSLDEHLPALRQIVVRGLSAASCLCETRQFYKRSAIYLTDFYTPTEDGPISTPTQILSVATCATHADTILVQTDAISKRIQNIANHKIKTFLLPPPIPSNLPPIVERDIGSNLLHIGYAGKIAENWGVSELLSLVANERNKGNKISLHIAANKISTQDWESKANLLEQLEVKYYSNLNRMSAMQLMAKMDYVWCWRPGNFENSTLELSTKLVEGVASGWRCICYPSSTNQELLGKDYPFFAASLQDVEEILTRPLTDLPNNLTDKLISKHSLPTIAKNFSKTVVGSTNTTKPQKILFSCHDFKFIDPFISNLKKEGHLIRRDTWNWGEPTDITRSAAYRDWADIIFCEWGLANAVWHSQNAVPGKKLFIRMHLQEVNARARRFGKAINIENVNKVIFVQEEVRQEAIRLWGWPEDKTILIPNFVLSDEYDIPARHNRNGLTLGIVGIIPQRKRFDRAINVLERLLADNHSAKLRIKGPRPETVPFMQAPGRASELEYYNQVYERINADPVLKGSVEFEGWGNDVAIWYREVDHILSCSDFESFHYALADGVLSGCQPLVWPWDGADTTYYPDWIVQDEADAVRRILAWQEMRDSLKFEQQKQNRERIINRYGHVKIFESLSTVLEIG